MAGFGGRPDRTAPGGVHCAASPDLAARLVLGARTVSRVIWQLGRELSPDPQNLADDVSRIPWETVLAGRRYAVRASGRSGTLRHTGHAARVVKDGIVLRFRARGLEPPPVDPRNPELLVDARIRRAGVDVGLDLAGRSLHPRGTDRRGRAPLREDVAAGLAVLAGAEGRRVLVDPFCGTGTLIAEAAALATGRPAGRAPTSTALPALEPFRGLPLDEPAHERRPAAPGPDLVLAFDADGTAVREAREALARQGLAGVVEVACRPIAALDLPAERGPGLLLTNPPWGRRLPGPAVGGAWRALGSLARSLPGWTLACLSGDPGLTRALGLRARRRWPVRVGGVHARWLVYDIAPPAG